MKPLVVRCYFAKTAKVVAHAFHATYILQHPLEGTNDVVVLVVFILDLMCYLSILSGVLSL